MRKKLKPNNYLLDLQFNDFDDFTNTVRDWNVEFRQLDRGQFHGKLFQVGSARVTAGVTDGAWRPIPLLIRQGLDMGPESSMISM